MTKQECAAEINGKTFSQVNELTEKFLTDMIKAELFLCFCPDDKHFHVIGAGTDVIKIAWDNPANANIIAYFDQEVHGALLFRRDREFVDDNFITLRDAPTGRLIAIKWGQTTPGRQGYTFTVSVDAIPVVIENDQNSCIGLVFTKDDLRIL
jgi:hypothetical protein